MRNKKETIYCYSDEEKQKAISKLGSKPEITRFKVWVRSLPKSLEVLLAKIYAFNRFAWGRSSSKVLEFYMGKNTPDRQDFIIDNLRIELDKVDKKEEVVTEKS